MQVRAILALGSLALFIGVAIGATSLDGLAVAGPLPTATPTVFGTYTPTFTATNTPSPTPCPTMGCPTRTPTLTPTNTLTPAPKGNDDFDATVFVGGLPYSNKQNTNTATVESGEPQPCAGIGSTIWYSFTPTSSTFLFADTEGSDYDTALAVYTGSSLGSLTLVECDDDSGPGTTSNISYVASAGVTYHFQVGGFSGDIGSVVFNLDGSKLPTPTFTPTPCPTSKVPVGDACGTPTPTPTPCPPAGCPTPTPTPTPTLTPTSTPCPPGKVPHLSTCATPTPTPTPGGPEMLLNIKGGACDDPDRPKTCDVPIGAKFTLSVDAAVAPQIGYVLAQTFIELGSDLIYEPTEHPIDEIVWPDCDETFAVRSQFPSNGYVNHGCISGTIPPLPISHFEGTIVEMSLTCSATESTTELQILPYAQPPAKTSGALYTYTLGVTFIPRTSGLTVNCVEPTLPPFPRMSKSPALQNVWLTRQGDKIPPTDCFSGTDVAELTEGLGQEIDSLSPKGEPQELAAFEFDLHYDNEKVCVMLTEGPEFAAANAICIIEDMATKPQLEGMARIGCVTQGKGHAIDEFQPLAFIDVYPHPELYSQAKPNQDNGVVVQLNNVNCDLADEQGHAIALFSCDDADVTFRYLEGDVNPDCVVDAIDAQTVAFRWGADYGSLIYVDFLNLEPSGAQADNDIDINDLQFVYGRFGSTCDDPHPPQDPVNPKGGVTPTSTPTDTPTHTPTPTDTPSDTPTRTPTPTKTNTPTLTPTFTPSNTPTITLTPTPTFTPTPCLPGLCPAMAMNVSGGSCDDPVQPTTCTVLLGATFTLSVNATAILSDGYTGFQTFVDYGSDLSYNPPASIDTIAWPLCWLPTEGPTYVAHACLTGILPPPRLTTFEGTLVEMSFLCSSSPSSSLVRLIPYGDPDALFDGSALWDAAVVPQPVIPADLTINCGS